MRSRTSASLRWEVGAGWLFVLLTGFVILNGLVSHQNIRELRESDQWVTHTHEVISSIRATAATLNQAESQARAYVISGLPTHRSSYEDAIGLVGEQLEGIDRDTRDNPKQQENIQRVRPLVAQRIRLFEDLLTLRDKSGFEAARDMVRGGEGTQVMNRITRILSEMEQEEKALLAARDVRSQGQAVRASSALYVSTVVGLLFLALAYFLIIRLIRTEVARRAEAERTAADLERRIQERTAELQVANDELESFSYSVSHDLRGPLRSMSGFAQLLEQDYSAGLPSEARDYISRIRNSAKRMSQLIDDLLRLSRVTRGNINLEEVDLSQMANEVMDEIGLRHPRENASVEIQPGMKAIGDRNLISFMLDNLLRNAWKYTGKKEQAVITFAQLPDGTFRVQDNGDGFDDTFADKVFQPFQRLHDDSQFEGTGIGLAIVQRVVQRHGGRVWAKSQPGEGATFYFTLDPIGKSMPDPRPEPLNLPNSK